MNNSKTQILEGNVLELFRNVTSESVDLICYLNPHKKGILLS